MSTEPQSKPPETPRQRLVRRLALGLRLVGYGLGVLALTAIFSLGGGVDRFIRLLAVAMDLYGAFIDFCVGLALDWVAGLVIELLRRYMDVAVGEHWKHVFTFLTLYAFADSFQFFARKDAPDQDPNQRRLLPFGNEAHMGLTSIITGFCLALLAAVIVGMAPLDDSFASGAVMIGAAVGAVFVYWLIIALAHARWNRWNFAQRKTPPEPMKEVESFGLAFRTRAMYAVRRSSLGLLLGLAVWWLVRTFSPAPAPGLIALGALAFALGVFWMWRSYASEKPEGACRDRLRRARLNHNWGMGRDIALRVAAGALVAILNAVLIGSQAAGSGAPPPA